MRVLRETTHIARKAHNEDSSVWIRELDYRTELNLTFSEWRTIAELKANNWKIMPGQKYVYQVGIYDGFYSVKVLPAIHDICVKYDLYIYD